jgi:very-short-patch-repair endonuclease
MTPAGLLRRQGGFATRAQLLKVFERRDVDAALAAGAIIWLSRGRYGLPELDLSVATAHGLNAVLSHTSAALWHGWEVKSVPRRTHVTVPRRRRIEEAPLVRRHRGDLRPDEVVNGIATSVERTLSDCLRTLPFDESLSIGDSALRHGVDPAVLARVAHSVRGPGRPNALRVAQHADREAANPFESCLRSIAIRIPALDVRAQRLLVGSRQTVRPDLVDERLRVVLEADSFEWHGDRAALKRDARRYNFMVIDGWLVLRFAYEDVMFDAGYVFDVLHCLVDTRTQVPPCPRCAA